MAEEFKCRQIQNNSIIHPHHEYTHPSFKKKTNNPKIAGLKKGFVGTQFGLISINIDLAKVYKKKATFEGVS